MLGVLPGWVADARDVLALAVVGVGALATSGTFVARRARRKVAEVMKPELDALRATITKAHIETKAQVVKSHDETQAQLAATGLVQAERWRENAAQHQVVVDRLDTMAATHREFKNRLVAIEEYIEHRIDTGRRT